ncbi:MAG: hypothetical protein P8X83_06930, partial [Nitrosopumilaceae archaeon]
QKSTSTSSFDTEMISMNAERADSFFDIFYESYTVDSFFDIWTELQESTDSFFDVFFDVATESSQNTEDIAELERKVSELERKIAELENGSTSGNVETEFKVEKGE